MCEALTELGHRTRIFAPREAPPLPAADLQAHYGLRLEPEIELHRSMRPLRRLDFVLRAQEAASAFRPDLIYTWLPQSAVLALRRKCPAVLELHADVGGRLGAWWLRQFWSGRPPKRLVVTTRALWSALERSTGAELPEDSVVIAPNGVDLIRYQQLPDAVEARRRLGLPARPTVGFTGHVYRGRGADLLLELARRMPEVGFLWAGGTEEAVSSWRRMLSEAGIHNLTVTGFVENSRLPLYQAAADVLLMPYGRSIEASSGQDIAEVINPMKMFEYMAAGRAIAAANLSVLREVLNAGNAVFCEPGNADEWEAALRSLLADEKRRTELGARARKDVQAFTWIARARKILDGFEPPA